MQAAQTAFGDLKQFGRRIEGYARQSSFMVGLVKSGEEVAEKSYTARSVSPGEIAAIRGDFFAHHNRLEQAQPVLQEAAQAEPNLAFAHEALGYYHYRQQKLGKADTEIQEALKLGAAGFAPQYFHGIFLLQQGRLDKTLRKEPRKAWKRRFSSIRSSRPPSKDCPRLMRGSRNCRRKRSTQLLKPFSWTPDSMFTL